MEKSDVIKRFCELATHVGKKVFEHELSHDCFCSDDNSFNFQFDEKIIKFIESAVNLQINGH